MSEQALRVQGGARTAAARVRHDGLPAMERALPGCRRRYLLVDVSEPFPFDGPWRQYRSAVDVIVLRGEIRVEWAAGAAGSTAVRAGEQATVAAGHRHRLLVDGPALFELYLPASGDGAGR